MESVINAKVFHKKFGEGVVMSLSDDMTKVRVMFDQFGDRLFAFPDAFNKFLTTTNEAILLALAERNSDKEKERIAREERLKKFDSIKCEKTKEYHSYEHKDKDISNVSYSDFFHRKAGVVDFDSEKDMYFALGFIARNLTTIVAELTDDRDIEFVDTFGDVDRSILDCSDSRSVCQFKIILNGNRTFPDVIENIVHKHESNYEISRSQFIFDLVHDFGFSFGETQNVNEIYEIVKSLGYGDDFIEGFMA